MMERIVNVNEKVLLEGMLNELIDLGYDIEGFNVEEDCCTIGIELYDILNKSDKWLKLSKEYLAEAQDIFNTKGSCEEVKKLIAKSNDYIGLCEENNKRFKMLNEYVEKHGNKDKECALLFSNKYFGLCSYIIFDKDFNIINVVPIC